MKFWKFSMVLKISKIAIYNNSHVSSWQNEMKYQLLVYVGASLAICSNFFLIFSAGGEFLSKGERLAICFGVLVQGSLYGYKWIWLNECVEPANSSFRLCDSFPAPRLPILLAWWVCPIRLSQFPNLPSNLTGPWGSVYHSLLACSSI